MNILFVLDNFSLGGLQRHILALVNNLIQKKYICRIAVLGDGAATSSLDSFHIPIEFLSSNESQIDTLSALLQKNPPDILFNTGSTLLRELLKDIKLDKTAIIEFLWGDCAPQMFCWSKANQIIACNSRTKKFFGRLFPEIEDILSIIDNPITITQFPKKKIANAWREKNQISKDTFLIGALGRFTPVKRYLRLIYEIIPFLKDVANSKLVIVGSNGNDDTADWLSTYDACEQLINELGLENKIVEQ